MIPSLIRRMIEAPERLEVWGSGEERRQFIYIDDQIEGIVRHLDYDGELLNVAGEADAYYRRHRADLAGLLDYKGQIVFGSTLSPAGFRKLDFRLAEGVSGWPGNMSFTPLEQGLAATVAATAAVRG